MTSPKLAKTTRSGRIYQHPLTGAQFPSVTTVLGTVGKGDALKHWAANEVAKYAVKNIDAWRTLDDAAAIDLLKREPLRFLDRAASRGTDVHALAEAYAKTGVLPEWAEEIDGYVTALRAFFNDHQPTPVLVEHTVFNSEVGYAGSFDMVCKLPQFGDDLCVLDYKTSKAIYPEVAAQLSAYAHGTEYIDDNDQSQPMPQIKRGVAVRFGANGDYEVIECDIEAAWVYFQAVRKVYDIPVKPFLLGNIAAPAGGVDLQQQRDWLRDRLQWLKDNNKAALADIAARWSPAIPSLKTDHQHTAEQLRAIKLLINDVEAQHNVEFHEHTPDPQAKKPTRPPKTAKPKSTVPSDEIDVDESVVEQLRNRLNSVHPKVTENAKLIAKQAAAAKRSISLNKPSMRRAYLVGVMLDILEESVETIDLLDAIMEHLGFKTADDTTGAALGALNMPQLQQMSEINDAIKRGDLGVTYTKTNGLQITRGEETAK